MRLKSASTQVGKLQSALEKSESQAKQREREWTAQTDQLKKQLKDYQIAYEDMREAVRQDQDQLQRETQKY